MLNTKLLDDLVSH